MKAVGAIDAAEDGELHPTEAGLPMFGKDRWITKVFPHYFLDYRQEAGAVERWVGRFTSQPGDWSGNVYDFYGKVYNKLKATLKARPGVVSSGWRSVCEGPNSDSERFAFLDELAASGTVNTMLAASCLVWEFPIEFGLST